MLPYILGKLLGYQRGIYFSRRNKQLVSLLYFCQHGRHVLNVIGVHMSAAHDVKCCHQRYGGSYDPNFTAFLSFSP